MIDLHSHILSGIDDGAKDNEMSIEMLKLASKSGVKEIVATPHFMRGRFDIEFKDVKEQVKELRKLAKENKKNIKINGSKYMLIELPMDEFEVEKVIDVIFELQLRGIIPILAHPERYIPFINEPTLINRFIDEGYIFQLNTGSLTGSFGRDVKKTAEKFLEHNIYSIAGTDGHRVKNRNTDVEEFLNIIDEERRKVFLENSKKLLKDEDISNNGNKIRKKKWFWNR